MLIVLLLCGAAFVLVSLFGDDSYSKLQTLRRSLEAQKSLNAELHGRVRGLDSEVRSIQVSDRELEKHARNELGLARPNELIFIFDDSSSSHGAEANGVSKQKSLPQQR